MYGAHLQALVEQGATWVYRQYSHDQRLLRLEEQARTARRGLWGLPDPIAPWDWRKSRKGKKVEVLSEAERSAGFQPDKRTCKGLPRKSLAVKRRLGNRPGCSPVARSPAAWWYRMRKS
ncbi:MAG: thermonuclease family protein, partial [Chthoniobacterales bacterium]|nr:thermonuclease family protein [Chthoniobacterales bacterium]